MDETPPAVESCRRRGGTRQTDHREGRVGALCL